MTMQELLIQSINISHTIIGVYNVDVTTPDNVSLLFKNTNGDNYCVDYNIILDGHNYIKTINFISRITNPYERFSSLDYTQEELNDMLKKVNK